MSQSNPAMELLALYGLMMEARKVASVLERDAELMVTGLRVHATTEDIDRAVERDRQSETGE